MKLAFSTLGCPEFNWSDIYSLAKDFGFDGIELRGMGDDIFNISGKPFASENLNATTERLKNLKLCIPCISSGCALKYGDREEANIKELTEYIELAGKLKTPFIRVLGDEKVFPEGDVDDAVVMRQLKRLLPVAKKNNVTLLVETNGVYADTKRLAKLLTDIKSDYVGALWDVHHPYRVNGETPQQTVQNLGIFIKYTHIKDSVSQDGKVVYKMMGYGDLPIDNIMRALRSINYEGFITLEWLKKYMPELESAGVVFSQFRTYMSKYDEIGSHQQKDASSVRKENLNIPHVKDQFNGELIYSNRHVGKYVWEKEHLIDLTFSQVLDRMVKEFPDQYAFRYTVLDYTRTYKEFRDDVNTFARSLIAMGVKKGDHVAIWATNVPAWYITFWATVKIGAVLVTVNTAYKIHEIEYLLRQSDTHTLVMIDSYKDCNYVDIIKEICPELETVEAPGQLHIEKLPFLRNIITVDSRQKGCYTWDDAIELAKEVPQSKVDEMAAKVDKHDVCNMQYTSGTTGFPKGVMLTHYNVVNNGKAIGDCMDLSTEDRMMIQVPMFHCFGMVLAMTASMTHGVTMSPIPAFSPTKGLDCINREKITCFHGVPTMFIAMLNNPNFETTDFSHMRTGIMAGSPCPIKVMREVIDKMHMPEICITYGQTEASPATTMSKTSDSIETRVNTVGASIFGVESKIVDPETNQEVPNGVDGEFVARGYNIMKGYYKMPEATASAIDEEGWLHSGDLARRDDNGYYKITGRIKDMIIRGGENIYPKEIEDFIYTHPKVSDVQVIGVPDKDYGEEIMAYVILKEGETMTEDELKEYVKTHMAKHKTPRYVAFVDGFPMNAAGKILKYKMREQAIEALGLNDAKNIETA